MRVQLARMAHLTLQVSSVVIAVLYAMQGPESLVGTPFIPVERAMVSAFFLMLFVILSQSLMLSVKRTMRKQVLIATYICILVSYAILDLTGKTKILETWLTFPYGRWQTPLFHYKILEDPILTPFLVLSAAAIIANRWQKRKTIDANLSTISGSSIVLTGLVIFSAILLTAQPIIIAITGILLLLNKHALAERYASIIDQVSVPLSALGVGLIAVILLCIWKRNRTDLPICTIAFAVAYGVIMVFENVVWFRGPAWASPRTELAVEADRFLVVPVALIVATYWFLGFFAVVAMIMQFCQSYGMSARSPRRASGSGAH